MYITPSKYRCEQGHEFEWSPHDVYRFWPSTVDADNKRSPVCPRCWNSMLMRERLLMKPVPVKKE